MILLVLLITAELFLDLSGGERPGLVYILDVAVALFTIGAVGLLTRFAGAKIRDTEHSASALGQAEARLTEVTDGIPGAVYQFELDEDGTMRFPFMSSGVEALYGVRAAQARAEPASMFEFVAEEDLPRLYSTIAASQASLQPWLCEYRIHLGEAIRWIRASSVPTRVSEQTVRWNGVLVDISSQKALEAQLVRSQKMEAVGQLTGGFAHDFNNLLTVIIGNGEDLLDSFPAESWEREAMAMIVAAAERGAALNESLLAFGRRQALEPGALDSNMVISEMEALLRRSLGEHILVHLELAPKLVPAFVDRAHLESALLNLAVNARDAMPSGGRLVIETETKLLDEEYAAHHEDLRPGEYVLISVSDTGAGIAPQVLARVFEPFFTTKDVGKGSGLGLSQVYGFVKQSNGHVSVYSEVGHGTVVNLYLPVSAKESGSVPLRAELEVEVPSGQETVLVVEDDSMVRQFAVRQLKSLGYAVLEAEDGPNAVDLLQSSAHIDLVFTDLVMPNGMTGRDVAETALSLRPAVKLVFASGYGQNVIVQQGKLDPSAPFLRKPYRKAELARVLREALDAYPSDRELSRQSAATGGGSLPAAAV
jgi:signal transduction histidine kinase/ActR/RegA family two-component response regulator